VPVICVDKKYWKGLFDWLDKNPKKAGFYIDNKADTSIVQFADSQEEVIKLIKKSGL
jgi:predicted Rossmann-fold nucleotide-binding protein